MEELIDMRLDYDKMSNDQWVLYFTGGKFQGHDFIRYIEPSVMHLNKNNYLNNNLDIFDIFYDPFKNNYNIELRTSEFDLHTEWYYDLGYHLGGFLINGDNLKFLYPAEKDVDYVNAFTNDFDEGFIEDSLIVDITDQTPSEFNYEFSFDFLVEGIDYTPRSGYKEIDDKAFDNSFAIK